MAHVYGQSGAWKEVVRQLGRHDVQVTTPDEIPGALERIKTEFGPAVEQKKAIVHVEIAEIQSQIEQLQTQAGVFRKILNWFRINRHESRIRTLASVPGDYADKLTRRILAVEKMLTSPDLVGARAELDVIRILAGLPDSFIVINDVHLHADEYVHFNGKPLQSAQVDHLVLCPGGVFVVETKHWSKAFAYSGRYHDPFDQVQRAAYLCYRVLSDRFGKLKVRSIIASQGDLPKSPTGSYVRVLPPNEVPGYIAWFKEPVLNDRQIDQIRQLIALRATPSRNYGGRVRLRLVTPPPVPKTTPGPKPVPKVMPKPKPMLASAIKLKCPLCRTIMRASRDDAGLIRKCNRCRSPLKVPVEVGPKPST